MLDFINKINNFKKSRPLEEEGEWLASLGGPGEKVKAEQLSGYLLDPKIARRVLVVDCRFDYEFRGGHIQDAVNINNPECLE